MAVRDAQTIDSIARASDGLLTLLLTEDRPYTPDSTPALAEQLRSKLNAYIYALKTRQVAEKREACCSAIARTSGSIARVAFVRGWAETVG